MQLCSLFSFRLVDITARCPSRCCCFCFCFCLLASCATAVRAGSEQRQDRTGQGWDTSSLRGKRSFVSGFLLWGNQMPRFEFSRESSAVPGHDRGDGDILLRDMRDLSPSVCSMQPLSKDSGCLVSFFYSPTSSSWS